jgi:uncharacterized UBP type Zn finger protein
VPAVTAPRRYPLVVKLGTITPHGADVFSYAPDENDMVLDPLLSEHLAHWGIDIMQVEKTEKTMAELQVCMCPHHFKLASSTCESTHVSTWSPHLAQTTRECRIKSGCGMCANVKGLWFGLCGVQVTKNFEHDWSKITEEGEDLEILSGPGLVGIANLGNSCYVNSVMQCLFSVPEVQSRYVDTRFYPSTARHFLRHIAHGDVGSGLRALAKFTAH